MSQSINFRPIFVDEKQPFCSVLRIDDCTILLDCGWDEEFNEDDMKQLVEILGEIDAVLITYPDLSHIGALPYLVKLGLSAPVYATMPVWQLGKMFFEETLQARASVGAELEAFSEADVDKAFDMIVKKEPEEEVRLAGRGDGVVVTPSVAGHILGGTFWTIVKDSESIVYAVDFNHLKERHLDGGTMEIRVKMPTLLITDALNARHEVPKRNLREEQLKSSVYETLQRGGDVLLPVDSAGRAFELLFLMQSMWEETGFLYPLVFLSPEAKTTIDFGRQMTSAASDAVRTKMQSDSANAFDLPRVLRAHSKEDLNTLRRPMAIVATGEALNTSLAQEILFELLGSQPHLVLLTSRVPDTSPFRLAPQLLRVAAAQAAAAAQNVLPPPMTVRFARRVPVQLHGAELAEWLARGGPKSDAADAAAAAAGGAVAAGEDDDDEDDKAMTDGAPAPDRAGGAAAAPGKPADRTAGLGLGGALGVYGPNAMAPKAGKKSEVSSASFPYHEPRRMFDAYGEVFHVATMRSIALTALAASGDTRGAVELAELQKEAAGKDAAAKAALEPESEAKSRAVGRVPNPERAARRAVRAAILRDARDVLCRVLFIDFEGRSSGAAAVNVIKAMRPKKIVLIHAEAGAKAAFRDAVLRAAKDYAPTVMLPERNQNVVVTSDSNVKRMTLVDSLVASLPFVRVGDYDFAYADAKLTVDYAVSDLPLLAPAPANLVRGHAAVLLGDSKFSDLKTVLNNNGVPAEFFDGVLVCGAEGQVSVRKVDSTHISVRGALSEEYFRVRSLLYGQFKML